MVKATMTTMMVITTRIEEIAMLVVMVIILAPVLLRNYVSTCDGQSVMMIIGVVV